MSQPAIMVENLPTPNATHHRILTTLLDLLRRTSGGQDGVVAFAPIPTHRFSGTIRELELLRIAPEKRSSDQVNAPTQSTPR